MTRTRRAPGDDDLARIVRQVVALDAAGLGISDLTDELIEAFQHQDGSYTSVGMTVGPKDRAELVVRIILARTWETAGA